MPSATVACRHKHCYSGERPREPTQVMRETSKRHNAASRAELVIVFAAVSAIIIFSYLTAHHAAENTPSDPAFRDLVRPESTKALFKTEYLYVPLLFQFIAWLALGASLLPARIRESWLLTTYRVTRRSLFFILAYCSLISVGIYSNSSNALTRASSPAAIDHNSSASAPNGTAR